MFAEMVDGNFLEMRDNLFWLCHRWGINILFADGFCRQQGNLKKKEFYSENSFFEIEKRSLLQYYVTELDLANHICKRDRQPLLNEEFLSFCLPSNFKLCWYL